MKPLGGSDFDATRIPLLSRQQILGWSYGEVLLPETINHRTLKPVKDGLFSEYIFGPTKDYECSCGKYRNILYKGMICDRCGVEVAPARVRRERMGHIDLAAPVAHACFAKGSPSPMALLLDISQCSLERVIYFSQYIVISVDEDRSRQAIKRVEQETYEKIAELGTGPATEAERPHVERELTQRVAEIENIRPLAMLTESRYRELRERYDFFRAGMGAEAPLEILKNLDLETLRAKLLQEASSTPSGQRKKAANRWREKAAARLHIVEALRRSGAKPEWMVLTALPVLPPGLRPVGEPDGGRSTSSELNDLYRRVIDRNNRLKRLRELGAPEPIIRKEKELIQKGVDAVVGSEEFWSLLFEVRERADKKLLLDRRIVVDMVTNFAQAMNRLHSIGRAAEDSLRLCTEAENLLAKIRELEVAQGQENAPIEKMWQELAAIARSIEGPLTHIEAAARALRERNKCWCGGTFRLTREMHTIPGPDTNWLQCDKCGKDVVR